MAEGNATRMTQSEIAEICSLRSGQFIRSGDFGYILDKGKIAHVWVSDAKRRTDFSQLVSQLSAFLINEQREPDKDYGAYWVAITLQEMAKSQEYTFVECTDPAHGGFIIFGGRIGPGKTPRTRWWWPFGSKVAAGKDRLETLRKEKEDAIEELKLAIGMGSGLDAHAIEEIVTAAVDHLDVGVKKPVDLVPEKDRPETLGKEDGIQPADPGFEWLKDAIWGKKWDEMPIEEIVTRLLGILRQDRKCKRVSTSAHCSFTATSNASASKWPETVCLTRFSRSAMNVPPVGFPPPQQSMWRGISFLTL